MYPNALFYDFLGDDFGMTFQPEAGDTGFHFIPVFFKDKLRIVILHHNCYTNPQGSNQGNTDPPHEPKNRLEGVEDFVVIGRSCHDAGSEVSVSVVFGMTNTPALIREFPQ